ncbi:hypothetical protein GO730_13790 [Spirosoma sp. HMF3257]|uniref:T9SS type A sorting domain-containing protein n=1 Tax=Spirosoma telluris TaxID=2183553 RepID=A0A327NWQ2_9BACT|nr:hypothetical protein [Spirosoma telluris]RAI78456.1 hypothetical protein HMF3257_13705 [Spirosoma telluris]
MKTSIKLLASAFVFALTISASTPSFATDGHPQNKAFAAVVFPSANASKLWVCLEKYQSENKITLQLLNQRGDVLFNEILCGKNSKQNAFRQQFDMNELGDGNYTFRITAGDQREDISIKLATPSLEAPTRLIAIK